MDFRLKVLNWAFSSGLEDNAKLFIFLEKNSKNFKFYSCLKLDLNVGLRF